MASSSRGVKPAWHRAWAPLLGSRPPFQEDIDIDMDIGTDVDVDMDRYTIDSKKFGYGCGVIYVVLPSSFVLGFAMALLQGSRVEATGKHHGSYEAAV